MGILGDLKELFQVLTVCVCTCAARLSNDDKGRDETVLRVIVEEIFPMCSWYSRTCDDSPWLGKDGCQGRGEYNEVLSDGDGKST